MTSRTRINDNISEFDEHVGRDADWDAAGDRFETSRVLKKSGPTGFEIGLVAEVVCELNLDRAVVEQFRRA